MTDEEVIKRRLLIDGDGTGDDRRLNVLLKSLIKWCNSDESQEENYQTLDKMLAQLSHCEYAMKKSRQVALMSAAGLENYKNLSNDIKKQIEEQKNDIEKTKIALKEAKTVRKNKMEYDLLGKVINEHPDRMKTGKKLESLKSELAGYEQNKQLLERKMANRRQQFNVLIVTINQLQNMLENDDSNLTSVESNEEDEDMIIIDDENKLN